MSDEKKLQFHFYSSNYEHQLKTANYLLAAHGACLVLALSVLKEYVSTPYLKGVGIFIALFGIGLLAAIVNYGSQSLGRSVALNAVMNATDPDEDTVKFISKVHLWALAISVGTFVLAIIWISIKFVTY